MDLALCLFRVFPYGGLQRDFLKVAKKALALGHRVTCYTMDWEGEKLPGLNLVLLPQKAWSNHGKCWQFAKALQKILPEKKHDRVLGFNRLPGLDFYFAGDLCFKAVAQKKHPYLSRILPRYRIYMALEKMVFDAEAHTQILLLNPKEEAVYQKYYHTPSARFHVIPPGISLPEKKLSRQEARNQLKLPLPEDANWLLMVGRDLNLKGCDRNLKAFAHLPKALQEKTCLMVVGEQGQEKFKQLAVSLGIEKHVLFLGPRADIDLLMQASNLLVHPAYQEVAGMVLIEALANGLPVLTTENCGYAFHIEAANAGVVVKGEPFSLEAYVKVLTGMLEAISTAAWSQHAAHYLQQHDLSNMTDDIIQLLMTREK